MDPPECPHAFMKMRVEVAVEDHVADRSCQAAGTMQNVKSITFLRAECDGIQNRRDRVLCFQTPLVIVKVEHMGLFYSVMYQADLCRITNVSAKDRRRRVSVDPGTH